MSSDCAPRTTAGIPSRLGATSPDRAPWNDAGKGRSPNPGHDGVPNRVTGSQMLAERSNKRGFPGERAGDQSSSWSVTPEKRRAGANEARTWLFRDGGAGGFATGLWETSLMLQARPFGHPEPVPAPPSCSTATPVQERLFPALTSPSPALKIQEMCRRRGNTGENDDKLQRKGLAEQKSQSPPAAAGQQPDQKASSSFSPKRRQELGEAPGATTGRDRGRAAAREAGGEGAGAPRQLAHRSLA
ncbi:hypothetical protein Anapl_10638 [Anas platyrhynchos]|uniref:Uncharacterized protein n=1 Tax=Anas platyrhynchos TaxID=8839 RepID=R0LKP6_ANAPL|nr:hypothetical protein Anapl_10638 [Anas platyrhynchos]